MISLLTAGSAYDLNHASIVILVFFFSSRRRHTRLVSDWSSDVCSSDLAGSRSTSTSPTTSKEVERIMPTILGTGAHRYEVVDNWAKLPPGREFNADVAAVGVDKQDRVYAFNRGKHPMVVLDRAGNFLRSWGEGLFPRAHGVYMAPDDTIWLTDDGDHTVRHCTLEGTVLLTLGIPDKPKPYMSGEPFHRCTHTALSPEGDLYVSDGYEIGRASCRERVTSRGG